MRTFILSSPLVRQLILRLAMRRGQSVIRQIQPFLQKNEKILDVGIGIGDVTLAMQDVSRDVTGLDVEDLCCTDKIKPILYDGYTMPFDDASFDVATIITTLHHAENPDRVLAESARVARRIIIMEDVFYSRPHKYATFFMDSLLNFEFFGHPHTNKNDAQWKATFAQLGLQLIEERSHKSFLVMRHKIYVLESKKGY